jgi:hypothetical protein
MIHIHWLNYNKVFLLACFAEWNDAILLLVIFVKGERLLVTEDKSVLLGHTIIYLSIILRVCFIPGEAMGKAWTLFSIVFISTQTMALYGCFSNLMNKGGDVLRAIALGVGAGLGLINVYMWCNEAQNVEQSVSILWIICYVEKL